MSKKFQVNSAIIYAVVISVLTLLATISFANEKIDAEKYFENVSPQERQSYIELAQTIRSNFNPSSTSDILTELSSTCDLEYKRDLNGKPILPIVECEYQPAKPSNPLDGMTSKFNCVFTKSNGKIKKQKVKYSLKDVDQKEIPQAVLTASMMRLMGFYANTYCPAIVRCKGCSQDPWSHKSQAEPIKNAVIDFKNAVIENKVKGEKISVPRTANDPKPLGFEWHELRKINKSLSSIDKKQLLIEREALMLFNNFVYHTDADPHNNRLVCRQWEQNEKGLKCTDIAAFTHDVGDSFKKMDFNFYKNYKPLSTGGLLSSACKGGLNSGKGIIVNAYYSEESKNEFLERFDHISDQQLSDLLELAQVRKMGIEPQSWISVLRSKANSMRSIKCPSITEKKSVLGR